MYPFVNQKFNNIVLTSEQFKKQPLASAKINKPIVNPFDKYNNQQIQYEKPKIIQPKEEQEEEEEEEENENEEVKKVEEKTKFNAKKYYRDRYKNDANFRQKQKEAQKRWYDNTYQTDRHPKINQIEKLERYVMLMERAKENLGKLYENNLNINGKDGENTK